MIRCMVSSRITMAIVPSRRLIRSLPKLTLFLIIGCSLIGIFKYRSELRERPFDRCVYRATILPLVYCPWPPLNVEDLRNHHTGLIDLSLKPIVSANQEGRADDIEADRLSWINSMHNISLPNASPLRRMFELEYRGRMFDKDTTYDLYPQAIDVLEAVRAVRSGKPVVTHPINDPTLEVVRTPQKICSAHDKAAGIAHLIVLIKSCATCFEGRRHARKTYMQSHLWPNFHVQFVFVTGIPMIPQPVKLDNTSITLPHLSNRYNTEPNLTKQFNRLLAESDKYDDLLIGNFSDTYYNLTIKQMLSFRWISAFCRNHAPIYLFLDNDYSVVPTSVMSMLASIPERLKPYINAGTFGPDRIVLHSDKRRERINPWTVSREEIPWETYPPYSSGAAYLLGYNQVVDAAIAMSFTRFFRLDDAYLGFVWNKLGSHVYTIPQMVHEIDKHAKLTDIISAPKRQLDVIMDWNTGRSLEGSNS